MRIIRNRIIAFLYWLTKNVIHSHLKVIFEGQDNIPNIKRALIVSNHSSYLDVPLIGMAFHKKLPILTWVVSLENRKVWFLKWVFFVFRVIFVNGATAKAIKELQKDRWIVVFPEGAGRWRCLGEPNERKARKGAAVIALTTGVPVIPIKISNADKAMPVKSFELNSAYTVTVKIGKPFSFEKVNQERLDETLLKKTTAEIMRRIEEINL